MNEQVRRALAKGHVIDITTIGRRSGEPRRIEIVFHNFGGRLYITGMPRALSGLSCRRRAIILSRCASRMGHA